RWNDALCRRDRGGAALGLSDRGAGRGQERAVAVAAWWQVGGRHGRLSALRLAGGPGGRADLRRHPGQWRHHHHLAGRPAYRAPSDAGPDDDQHLLWRPGHEDGLYNPVLDRPARRGRLADPRPQAQSGWLNRVSAAGSRGSSDRGGAAGGLATAAFSRSRRDTGCGTQGRSPRLSLALTTVTPSGSSHSATAPWRQVSMLSTTAILP